MPWPYNSFSSSSREGYAPIRDYAAIGDGRTAALIALDGSIDWLCLPDLDSPSTFASLLDPNRGGQFRLAPDQWHNAERRYLPGTNVLETTFTTSDGKVRVTDAMLLPTTGLAPDRELARRVEGLSGSVRLRWSVDPRPRYGQDPPAIGRRLGVPVAIAGADAIAVCSWEAGEPQCADAQIAGSFVAEPGTSALIDLCYAHGSPLVLASRSEVEGRFEATDDFWRTWAEKRRYRGPWREAVLRSALALKLLIHSPSGAISAAASTSLPEEIGGARNWDYRFSWVRDASATLDALLRLGCPAEAHAFFWWLLHASQLTHPRLNVLYRLNGGTHASERELDLEGYMHSRPVRVGNAAASQVQLDVYGHLLQTAWLFAREKGTLSSDSGKRLAETADLVCEQWKHEDSGIWEVRGPPRQFTESKMMCWVALDRARRLAEEQHIPSGHSNWDRHTEAIREFVNERCWSQELRSYVRFAGAEETDASVLLPVMLGYGAGKDDERLASTIDRVREELGRGPLLYRYLGKDGLPGDEGAFLTCSFWLVDALARMGRIDEAASVMDEVLALSNDVGLYAEEIDPESGEFLGNFPQGLTHLALINAAATLEEEMTR
jgi:GH15 family glucan-1,4-alpha-glucosidase